MEPIGRQHGRNKEGTWYHVLSFITGEAVTIFDDGIWNYDDCMTFDAWRAGGFFKDEHGKTYVTESSGKRPPAVVYDALRDLEYDVVEPKNEMKS